MDLDMLDTQSGEVPITLVLARGGARLTGRVTDGHSNPIEDVLVVVGDENSFKTMRVDRSSQEYWGPRAARTDADGRFEIHGLSPGLNAVQARHAAYALWSGKISLNTGREQELNLSLSIGSTVRGTVCNESGQPIPNAVVLVTHEPLRRANLQSGYVHPAGVLLCPSAITDELGSYELVKAAPGAMSFFAVEPREKGGPRYQVLRHVTAQITLHEGEETIWDPVLVSGPEIRGRALYADGSPIEGVFLLLRDESLDDDRVAFTEDGTFRFIGLDEGPYSVRVQMRERPRGHADPSIDNIYPDGPVIDVIADFDSPREVPQAIIRVRLIDEVVPLARESTVVLESTESHATALGESRDGLWTFKVDDPGAYRAVALINDRCITAGQEFFVKGGEVLELPDLIAGPGGTLVLAFEVPSDPAPKGIRAFLRQTGRMSAEMFDVGALRELRIENLMPGAGRVSFLGQNIRQIELEYEVRAEEETVLTVPLTAAVPVRYRIKWLSDRGTGSMKIRFTDRDSGEVVDHFDIDDLTRYTSPIKWSAFLPLGSYHYEVLKDGKPHDSTDFEVTSLDPKLAPSIGGH